MSAGHEGLNWPKTANRTRFGNQGRFRAHERLQRFFISSVALMEINGTSGVVFEAGSEGT